MVKPIPAEVKQDALRLREHHRSYRDIARLMAARHGFVLSAETWRLKLGSPIPPVLAPSFAEAYRAALAVGFDPFEQWDVLYECRACGHLPCACVKAAA